MDSLPVVSTCVEIRRNTGRAYGGRDRWTFSKKPLQSKLPVASAMAAMPALPSTPGMTHGDTCLSSCEYSQKQFAIKRNDSYAPEVTLKAVSIQR